MDSSTTAVGGSVAEFVSHAFPKGTVPSDLTEAYKDYSYNFLSYPYWEAGGAYQPKNVDELSQQFPMWPADLFAVTSSLLERSAAYQRLADAVLPNDSRTRSEIDWTVARADLDVPTETDPFCVRSPHRLFLRLAGALWSYGALFFSGLHVVTNAPDGSGGEPQIALSPPSKLIELNRNAADRAVNFLRDRFNREIRESDLDAAVQAIVSYVFDDLLYDKVLTVGLDEEGLRATGICPTPASLHAVQAIQRLFAQEMGSGQEQSPESKPRQAKRHIDLEGVVRDSRPYCLIIWATNLIQQHWLDLKGSHRPISLSALRKGDDEDYQWWRAAIRLLIIADEAGKGIGFSRTPKLHPRSSNPVKPPPFRNPVQKVAGLECRDVWDHYYQGRDHTRQESFAKNPERSALLARTLTTCFNEEFGAVLPKTHTPMNGCTIRSLSHNLALLPPKGRVRARWARQSEPMDRAAYNILLIPYPFRISAKHFEPFKTPEDSEGDWGFFEVKPGWLTDPPEDDPTDDEPLPSTEEDSADDDEVVSEPLHPVRFWKFLTSLLDHAGDTVNAVMLPEAALDWHAFEWAQARIPIEYPHIELLVCGLTSAKIGTNSSIDPGNYVATYMRNKDAYNRETGEQGWLIQHIRSKHHRWRVDPMQLRRYALSSRLAPDRLWWEGIELPPREMLFAEFAPGSVVTSLICEDLARIEPCQVALRSVGPNLVLVLLMDSAQTVGRWPYQYAGVLTDDPGSSILTLTSFGLVHRANLSDGKSNREIALWREPGTGYTRAIDLPAKHHAQLVSLRRDLGLERTLDGRDDNGDCAVTWRFAGLTPIKSAVLPPGGGPDD